jgi:hypothetical protein
VLENDERYDTDLTEEAWALIAPILPAQRSVYQAASLADAQRRVYDIIESSLSAVQVNVDSALKTNIKIIADWKELVDRLALGESQYRSGAL